MKKLFALGVLLSALMVFTSPSAHAVSIGFDPSNSTALIGDPVSIDLVIEGLGDPGAPSVSIFDLDITFDTAILGLTGVTFGGPVLGDQLDLFGLGFPVAFDTPIAGGVNLFELSFNTVFDLDTFQAGSFTLATLSFNTLAVGTSSIGIGINVLGDSVGDSITASTASGSVVVTPEPASLVLMGSGLLGLAMYRRRAWGKSKKI